MVNGFIDESKLKPLDKKTAGLFQKEYTTVFRYRGKDFVDLTDTHECMVFYAKMTGSICGGILNRTVIAGDKEKDIPASCKYKYDIEVIKNHLELLCHRKKVDTTEYDKYYEENKPKYKSKGIAQKYKHIKTIQKNRIPK